MRKILGTFIVTLLIGTFVSQVSACTGFTYNDENNVLPQNNLIENNVFKNGRDGITSS